MLSLYINKRAVPKNSPRTAGRRCFYSSEYDEKLTYFNDLFKRHSTNMYKGSVHTAFLFGFEMSKKARKKFLRERATLVHSSEIKSIIPDMICTPDTSNLTYFLDNRLEGSVISDDRIITASVQKKIYSLVDFLFVVVASKEEDVLLETYINQFGSIESAIFTSSRICHDPVVIAVETVCHSLAGMDRAHYKIIEDIKEFHAGGISVE